mmetsp:Transcript_21871/g.86835  ORF Transcript_21871/g.86835 Transcript_21871/m.86835 type:complete len:290 (-) Transcript_21871:82-951(-)
MRRLGVPRTTPIDASPSHSILDATHRGALAGHVTAPRHASARSRTHLRTSRSSHVPDIHVFGAHSIHGGWAIVSRWYRITGAPLKTTETSVGKQVRTVGLCRRARGVPRRRARERGGRRRRARRRRRRSTGRRRFCVCAVVGRTRSRRGVFVGEFLGPRRRRRELRLAVPVPIERPVVVVVVVRVGLLLFRWSRAARFARGGRRGRSAIRGASARAPMELPVRPLTRRRAVRDLLARRARLELLVRRAAARALGRRRLGLRRRRRFGGLGLLVRVDDALELAVVDRHSS